MEITTTAPSIVIEVWRNHLWPQRKSLIRPTSSMRFLGGTDMSIHEFADPIFWMCEADGQVVGVNSAHETESGVLRSRGLWVAPSYRRKGIGSQLLQTAINEGKKRGCNFIWSMPRTASLSTYVQAGFKVCSDSFMENVEFGPNLYVAKTLKSRQ